MVRGKNRRSGRLTKCILTESWRISQIFRMGNWLVLDSSVRMQGRKFYRSKKPCKRGGAK